jgi:hypothetical protein
MSWLLFLDESGHDRKNMPYEVHGGIALHASKIWPFVQAMKTLETSCFGDVLSRYKSELKGSHVLQKERFKWAAQGPEMNDVVRRKHAQAFLYKGLEKKAPTRDEFTAYGQACLKMVRDMFSILMSFDAALFAVAIPHNAIRPDSYDANEHLRKDQVFLFERFFYFLEHKREHGVLILDQIEAQEDRRNARRIESYFTKTVPGRERSCWVVPSPFFVSSDMTYGTQAADVCIYCINCAYRLPTKGMDAPVRTEIESQFLPWVKKLEFRGQGMREGRVTDLWGFTFVANPYGAGAHQSK